MGGRLPRVNGAVSDPPAAVSRRRGASSAAARPLPCLAGSVRLQVKCLPTFMRSAVILPLVLLALLPGACKESATNGPSKPSTTPTTRPGPGVPVLHPKPVPTIERALVVSIDGLRPDLILRADAPHLRALLRR